MGTVKVTSGVRQDCHPGSTPGVPTAHNSEDDMTTTKKNELDRWQTPCGKAGLDRLVDENLRAEINRGLPRFLAGAADRLIRAMISECMRSPKLFDCTPASLFGAVIQAGQLGFTIGGPLGEAWIIPFKRSATLIIGYKGFLTLAHRSAMVRRVTPRVVREGEPFDVRQGTNQCIVHQSIRNNDKPVTDYYVVVETVSDGVDFETATTEEMVAFRDRYSMVRNADEHIRNKSPWYDTRPGIIQNGFDQMALKTLIRRLSKRMPMSPELSIASGLDEMADNQQPQRLEQHVPQAESSMTEELQEQLHAATKTDYTPGVDDPDNDPGK